MHLSFSSCLVMLIFCFKEAAAPEIYTLSLHDALPISARHGQRGQPAARAFGAALPGLGAVGRAAAAQRRDRKSTRLNSSHVAISYAVFCLKKKKKPLETSSHIQST